MNQTEFNLAELDRTLEGIADDMDLLRAKLNVLSREYAAALLQKMCVEAMAGRIAA